MALISQGIIEHQYALLTTCLTNALSLVSSDITFINSGVRTSARTRVHLVLELLSRIALRLSPKQLETELIRAIDLYCSPIFQNDLSLFDDLVDLFRRLFGSMSASTISSQLLRLISLPIPGKEGFSPRAVEIWFDPSALLPADIPGVTRDGDPADWDRTIRKLISIATEDLLAARRIAIIRLGQLEDYKILSQSQTDSFAQAVWSRTDGVTGLPCDIGYFEDYVLLLPSPPGVSAIS